MKVGEQTYISVDAGRIWNDSRIDVAVGESYDFNVPNGEVWTDWTIPCDADGYVSTPSIRLWEPLRRVPSENWFKLIGVVGKSTDASIVIGSSLSNFSTTIPGRLFFFANDLWWMYWNNKGRIGVWVKRLG
jgi:hypothetical protein